MTFLRQACDSFHEPRAEAPYLLATGILAGASVHDHCAPIKNFKKKIRAALGPRCEARNPYQRSSTFVPLHPSIGDETMGP